MIISGNTAGGGGGGTPGGISGELQYNAAGSFGGTSGLMWDPADNGSLFMMTAAIFMRFDTDGNIDLIGGSGTQSGYSVGSDDSVIWGNTALRMAIRFDGSLELNNTVGVAGQALVTNGAGTPPTWQTVSGTLSAQVDSSGYQDVLFTTPKVGGSSTGLANDATVYSAQIDVDGVTNNVDVTGSAAQNYTNLINEINNDLSGATAALVSGQIRVTSASTGASSAISILDIGPLFGALTDFRSIHGPAPGLPADGNTARWNGGAWEGTAQAKITDADGNIQIGPIVSYPSSGPGGSVLVYAQGGGFNGDNDGGQVQIVGGFANGSGAGGSLSLLAGAGSGNAGAGGDSDVSDGGTVYIASGSGFNSASGEILIEVPQPTGAIEDMNGNRITLRGGTGVSNAAPVFGGGLYLIPGEQAGGGTDGNVVAGLSAIDSSSRDGNFLYIPTTAGAPSGTPITEGFLMPFTYDYTNQRLYIYDTNAAQWRFVATTT